jgi:hypothetical protein
VNRRALLAALALFGGASATAQTAKAEGRTYTPGKFDSIEINGSASVTFVQGSVDQVVVEGGDEVQRAVCWSCTTAPCGSTRAARGSSGTRAGSHRGHGARAGPHLDLRRRRLHRGRPGPAERLAVAISGAGAVRFDKVDAETLNFQVSGSGDGQVAGAARELVLRISGAASSAARR